MPESTSRDGGPGGDETVVMTRYPYGVRTKKRESGGPGPAIDALFDLARALRRPPRKRQVIEDARI